MAEVAGRLFSGQYPHNVSLLTRSFLQTVPFHKESICNETLSQQNGDGESLRINYLDFLFMFFYFKPMSKIANLFL